MRRFVFVLVVALALLVPVMTSKTRADAPPPPQLVRVLAELQRLDDDRFLKVTQWAKGKGSGSIRAIDDLESGQKYAIMQWLQGYGRHDLYNLRVTDDQIGPQRAGADLPDPSTPTPSPTPIPWREISMSGPVAGADPSNIAFIGGFAAARPSGTGFAACVSFQNNAAKTAKVVHFDMILRDQSGMPFETIPFDRKGTFSSGIAIRTYRSFYDFVNSGYNVNPKYNDNCVSQDTFVQQVRSVTYQVTHVEYDDGTEWNASGTTAADALPLALTKQVHTNGWTYLPTVNALLNKPPDGSGIEVLRGFGAVPDDASSIDVCIAFRNKGTKVATHVDFLYTMMAGDGRTFGVLSFSRDGAFSPGAEIKTFEFSQFAGLSLPTNHAFRDNCVFHSTKTGLTFNPATYLILYRVTHVDYADGTSWVAPASQ